MIAHTWCLFTHCFTSVGEYEIYMMESSAFVFYGMESFLTQLPPYKVASLNFDGTCCSIARRAFAMLKASNQQLHVHVMMYMYVCM